MVSSRSVIIVVVELLIVCAATLLWDWVFHNPTCDFLFDCGCTWNWAGGWDDCNVHSTDPNVPKCPYCSSSPSVSWTTQWGVMGVMIVSYYLIAYYPLYSSFFRSKIIQNTDKSLPKTSFSFTLKPTLPNLALRFCVPPFAFWLSSLIVGFAFYVCSDYPIFIIDWS